MLRRLRKTLFWLYGHLLPGRAARAFERAILIPRSPVGAGRALPLPPGGTPTRVPYGDGTLAARVWDGSAASRGTVLLVHGWGSSMSRLAGFVEPLTAAGYRVVAYDHPAHGASDGKRTTMLQCADALQQLGRRLGPIDVVVGHSFGGPTAALAGIEGLPYRGLVMLASPLDMIQQTIDAGVMLGIPRHVAERMARELAQRLAVDWTELETDRLVAQLGVPVLVVHDRHDPIVPFREAEVIAAAARHGRLIATEGLGHRDILSDPEVQRLVLSFLDETDRPAPAQPRRAVRTDSAERA